MSKFTEILIHLFYPHRDNNHRAKLRQHTGLIGLISLVLFAQVWIQLLTATKPQILGYAANISSEVILELTNKKRAEMGLDRLRLDQQLSQAAQSKANDMFNRDYWAHVTPTGQQPWSFITDTGYTYLYAGENLARDFSDPQAVVDAWMASASHRENLLNANYDDIGIAVVDGDLNGINTTLIVQMFGARRIATQPQEISQVAQATKSEKVISESIQVPIVTSAPTNQTQISISPSPTSIPITAASDEITPTKFGTAPIITPFAVDKSLGLAIAGLLAGVLVIDEIVMRRKHLGRIAGRSWAHLAFLITTLGILVLSHQGVIL